MAKALDHYTCSILVHSTSGVDNCTHYWNMLPKKITSQEMGGRRVILMDDSNLFLFTSGADKYLPFSRFGRLGHSSFYDNLWANVGLFNTHHRYGNLVVMDGRIFITLPLICTFFPNGTFGVFWKCMSKL